METYEIRDLGFLHLPDVRQLNAFLPQLTFPQPQFQSDSPKPMTKSKENPGCTDQREYVVYSFHSFLTKSPKLSINKVNRWVGEGRIVIESLSFHSLDMKWRKKQEMLFLRKASILGLESHQPKPELSQLCCICVLNPSLKINPY